MWQPKTDSDLARDVRDALLWDPSIESADITADAEDGVVTLSGAVPSYAMRAAAGCLAERRRGAGRRTASGGPDSRRTPPSARCAT